MDSTLVASENLIKAERWDFEYFSPEFLNTIQQINQSGWTVKRLEEIVITLTDGQHGYLNHLSDGIPLIRTTNVFPNEIRLDNVRYISPEAHAEIKRSQLKPGDVLLVTIGVTLGVSAVVDDSIGEANINQNLVKITTKAEVNPYYLSLFFNSRFGKIQTQVSAAKSVVPIVNYARLRKMLVPLPPRHIQDRIAQIMQDVYHIHKEKIKTSQEMITNIDQFILDTLGIKFENSQKNKNFLVNIKQLKGSRFDVDFYSPKFDNLYTALRQCENYQLFPLSQLIKPLVNGATPKGANYQTDGIPFFRIQNITPEGIDFSDLCFIDNATHEKMRRSKTKPRDLLMTITGRVGTAAVIPKTIQEGNINQHIVILRVKNDFLDINYLEAIINSSAVKFQAEHRNTGTTRIALDYPAINSFLIPIPSFEVQQDIVKEINLRRTKAQILRFEADNLIIETKARVERMILGEEEVT